MSEREVLSACFLGDSSYTILVIDLLCLNRPHVLAISLVCKFIRVLRTYLIMIELLIP